MTDSLCLVSMFLGYLTAEACEILMPTAAIPRRLAQKGFPVFALKQK
ncbi:MAG: hypothetical protein WBL40_11720 [Terrimicrobiaceae bacterium]